MALSSGSGLKGIGSGPTSLSGRETLSEHPGLLA